MTGPDISVIVPSYNKPYYLAECLRSVQAQTINNWECIVVNDASPMRDVILSTVNSFHDSRFQLIDHDLNRGLAAARNTGIRNARGNKVICVDEDDALHPSALAVLSCEMIRSGAEIVCAATKETEGSSRTMRYSLASEQEILMKQPLPGCGFLMHKCTWSRLGGYDESSVLVAGREDHEWWIRAIFEKVSTSIIDVPLYYYRRPNTPLARKQSLNISGLNKESIIARYLIHKHSEKYKFHPGAKKALLARAFRVEARMARDNNEYCRSAIRSWQAWLWNQTKENMAFAARATARTIMKCIKP